MNQRFEAGQFITFTYNPPEKPQKVARPTVKNVRQPDGTTKQAIIPAPPLKAEPPRDKAKQILVLHPNWHMKVHGIDLGNLTPAEGQVLRAIMDPETKRQLDDGKWPVPGVPSYPLIRDILTRLDPVELIKTPLTFYQQLIKPFIRDKDCYRIYNPQYIFGVRIVEESKVRGSMINTASVFKKPLFGPK